MSSENTMLLSLPELGQCASVEEHHRKRARLVIPLMVWVTALAIIQSFVGYVEYELVYQIFDFVSGEEGYYSTSIMACTGILMIAGFHIGSTHYPNSFAIRFINTAAMIFIVFYGLGLGLLLMAMLYVDGLAELVESALGALFSPQEQEESMNWLDTVFQDYANPIAVLIFSVAVGGLTIVNMSISHSLLTAIKNSAKSAFERRAHARDAKRHYKTILRCQADYQDITQQRNALEQLHNNALASEIATEAMTTIRGELASHKAVLKQFEFSEEPSRFVWPETTPPDPKVLSKSIQAIERITIKDIFKVLNSTTYQE